MGGPVFTATDDDLILKLYQERGPDWTYIHQQVGKGTRNSVRQRWQQYVKFRLADHPYVPPDPAPATFDNPVRPLKLPKLDRAVKKKRDGGTVALIYGDTHFPYHDPKAIKCVLEIARTLQPDIIIHLGDLLDCYGLSAFDKDPMRIKSLQDEINEGRFHLAEMRRAAPGAAFYLFEGNHEDRLRRTLWRLTGTSQELMTLTAFQEAMTWQTLLNLPELDIAWVPIAQQSRTEILPKFIVKHGDRVRIRSGYTAHAEHARYGRSGASGHTHRLCAVWHRDHNGNHVWCETGCLCTLNPEYAQDPDWQQGCVVVSFEEFTSAVSIEPVYIQNGLAQWRGKTIRAA